MQPGCLHRYLICNAHTSGSMQAQGCEGSWTSCSPVGPEVLRACRHLCMQACTVLKAGEVDLGGRGGGGSGQAHHNASRLEGGKNLPQVFQDSTGRVACTPLHCLIQGCHVFHQHLHRCTLLLLPLYRYTICRQAFATKQKLARPGMASRYAHHNRLQKDANIPSCYMSCGHDWVQIYPTGRPIVLRRIIVCRVSEPYLQRLLQLLCMAVLSNTGRRESLVSGHMQQDVDICKQHLPAQQQHQHLRLLDIHGTRRSAYKKSL